MEFVRLWNMRTYFMRFVTAITSAKSTLDRYCNGLHKGLTSISWVFCHYFYGGQTYQALSIFLLWHILIQQWGWHICSLMEVFKLHGMLKIIVFDKDLIFTSSFWQKLFNLQETTLAFSYAYHLQTNGQIETLNKCMKIYLRCYIGTRHKYWSLWLPMAN